MTPPPDPPVRASAEWTPRGSLEHVGSPLKSDGSATHGHNLDRTSFTRTSLARTSRRLVDVLTDTTIIQQIAMGADGLMGRGNIGTSQYTGPGNLDEHGQQEYQDLVAAAVQRHNQQNRPSLDIRLPRTVTYGAGKGEDGLNVDQAEVDSVVDVHVDDLARTSQHMGRRLLLDHAMRTQDQNNGILLQRMRERMDKVGLSWPEIEVRFENICVNADVNTNTSARANVLNFFWGKVRTALTMAHIMKPTTSDFDILHNVSGVLKPGRLTLLLGPPGAGKTTLLETLGRVVVNGDHGLHIRGKVEYNGEPHSEFTARRTAAYVAQEDNHMGELTVRETLGYSTAYQGTGVLPAMVDELRRREEAAGITPDPVMVAYMKAAAMEGVTHHIAVDMVLRMMGLEVCADTAVGSAMMRGVSGGQRKRVSTAEFLVGPARVLLLDEISTGLDSATTYMVTNCLRNMAHETRATILVSLLQPPPEVYDLFDDILVLSEGRVVFHGQREEVKPFFASIGFPVPPRKSVPDFLQEVTSRKDQAQFWHGGEANAPFMPVNEMAALFVKSKEGLARAAELATPYVPQAQQPTVVVHDDSEHSTGSNSNMVKAHVKPVDASGSHDKAGHSRDWPPDPLTRTEFANPGWRSFVVSLDRDKILMSRFKVLYIFILVKTTFMAVLFSTLFLKDRMDPGTLRGGQLYLSIIFFSVMTAMMSGGAEMMMLLQHIGVFFKQRNAKFYPSFAFTLPPVVMRNWVSFLDVLVWALIVYWVTGLSPDAGRFFCYLAYLFLMSQMCIGLFRFLASVARNFDVANSYGSLAMIVLMVMSGFVMARTKIPDWWIWAYWLSPITYVHQGMSINELSAPRWQNPRMEFEGVDMSVGDAVLKSYGMWTDYYWRWMGLLVTLGYTILFQILAAAALKYLDAYEGDKPLMSLEFLRERDISIGRAQEPTAITINSNKAANALAAKPIPANSSVEMSGPRPVAEAYENPPLPGMVDSGRLPQVQPPPATSGRQVASVGKAPRAVLESVDANADEPKRQGTQHSQHGMVLPFTPMAMTFAKVCYNVPMPSDYEEYHDMVAAGNSDPQLQLLTDITGSFRPGVLTALMGVSGAGKTTLMDVLAGRKNQGTITGDIFVGGFPKVQDTFARISGYVEQADIHCPRTTVREALWVSARLRLEDDAGVVDKFVDEVLELVELGPQRDSIVGIPGSWGLSVEQRKRLTIAVELVANPSIIFMDEPTSGLDARAAKVVMRSVRNAVDTGRTVVCTIHQPSIDIFEAFDELLLLKRGGRTIYHGPLGVHSADLIKYFMQVPGVSPCEEGMNPATWMLEISTISGEKKVGLDFADAWEESAQRKIVDSQVAEESRLLPDAKPLHFRSLHAQGMGVQFIVLMKRILIQYWRNDTYNGVRMAYAIVLGLVLGSMYWDVGTDRSTPVEVFNIIGALFLCINFLGTYNTNGVLPVLGDDRPVLYRERAAGMYNSYVYAATWAIVEIPFVLVQSIVYGVITYYMIQFDFESGKVAWFLFFTFLLLLFYTAFGMFIMSITPFKEVAMVAASMFFSIWAVFGGFFIPYPEMPDWWSWLYWVNPLTYCLYGIIASQLGDVTDLLDFGDGSDPVTVKQFLIDRFDYQYDNIWKCALVLIAFIVFFIFVFGWATARVNFSRR